MRAWKWSWFVQQCLRFDEKSRLKATCYTPLVLRCETGRLLDGFATQRTSQLTTQRTGQLTNQQTTQLISQCTLNSLLNVPLNSLINAPLSSPGSTHQTNSEGWSDHRGRIPVAGVWCTPPRCCKLTWCRVTARWGPTQWRALVQWRRKDSPWSTSCLPG